MGKVIAADLWRALEELAVPHRAQRAFWHLVLSGPAALPIVRAGLADDRAEVRAHCVRVLDHLADDSSFADLVGMLDDPSAAVRQHALHALVCDRCKEGACRPSKGDVLPVAMRLLAHDPDQHVRAMAVEAVARWAHTDEAAEAALVRARDEDPHPAVRKKAGWFAPGGPIHRKTAKRVSPPAGG
jgi:HEAT repeat protein